MFDALLRCAGERKATAQKTVSKTKIEAFRRPSTRLISASGGALDLYNTPDKLLICFPLAWQAKSSATVKSLFECKKQENPGKSQAVHPPRVGAWPGNDLNLYEESRNRPMASFSPSVLFKLPIPDNCIELSVFLYYNIHNARNVSFECLSSAAAKRRFCCGPRG